ncbi:MAG: MurR/RpiR family transcriptional regulator, partial [Roseiarcus sp.]
MNSALERTRATRPTLRKSEAKVADLVLADPARILDSSLAGVAELAGVSQPTVIRFCVALGYSGFQEFKLRLAQNLALGRSATHSVISDRDGLSAVTDKIFEYTLTSLDWARRHLDRAALEQAVDILAGARSIAFFGYGASAIVAMDAQQKFPLFDVPSRAEVDA